VREPLLQRDLHRVVIGIGDRVLGEDAGEHRRAILRTACTGQRIAIRRRVPPQSYELEVVGKRSSLGNDRGAAAIGRIWQMERHWQSRTGRNRECAVREELAAGAVSQN
jgi:hypothetical protein